MFKPIKTNLVGFEFCMVLTVRSTASWIVTHCISEKAQCFGGTRHLCLQG